MTHAWKFCMMRSRGILPRAARLLRAVLKGLPGPLAAVLLRISELAREFAGTAADEDERHVRARQLPRRRAGRQMRAGQVRLLMAGRTPHRVEAFAVFAALHVHRVR